MIARLQRRVARGKVAPPVSSSSSSTGATRQRPPVQPDAKKRRRVRHSSPGVSIFGESCAEDEEETESEDWEESEDDDEENSGEEDAETEADETASRSGRTITRKRPAKRHSAIELARAKPRAKAVFCRTGGDSSDEEGDCDGVSEEDVEKAMGKIMSADLDLLLSDIQERMAEEQAQEAEKGIGVACWIPPQPKKRHREWMVTLRLLKNVPKAVRDCITDANNRTTKTKLHKFLMAMWWRALEEIGKEVQGKDSVKLPTNSNISSALFAEIGALNLQEVEDHGHMLLRSKNPLCGSHRREGWLRKFFPDLIIRVGTTSASKSRSPAELYCCSFELQKHLDLQPSLTPGFRFRAHTVDTQGKQMTKRLRGAASYGDVHDELDKKAYAGIEEPSEIFSMWRKKCDEFKKVQHVQEKLKKFQQYFVYFGLRNWCQKLGSRATKELSAIVDTRSDCDGGEIKSRTIRQQVQISEQKECVCNKNRRKEGEWRDSDYYREDVAKAIRSGLLASVSQAEAMVDAEYRRVWQLTKSEGWWEAWANRRTSITQFKTSGGTRRPSRRKWDN